MEPDSRLGCVFIDFRYCQVTKRPNIRIRYQRLPVHGWCFLLGFLLPPLWWAGCFLSPSRVVISRLRDNGLIEEWNELDPYAITWRFRCRLVSVLTIILYVPIITLAIIFK